MVRSGFLISVCCIALASAAASAQPGSYNLLYNFTGGSDGGKPASGLIQINGILYGTTPSGGASYGTVYSLDPVTGIEHAYALPYTVAQAPQDSLIKLGGLLVGTSALGGSKLSGSVFSFDPTSGTEQLIYSFTGRAHGIYPTASLLDVGGKLYGTTPSGGMSKNCDHVRYRAPGCGTVFELNPKTGAAKVIYSFQGGVDGTYPSTGLINVGGILFGATELGGSSACDGQGCGEIYSVDPATGVKKIVYAFQGSGDGGGPTGSLLNVGGTLYGTTFGGGLSCNCGTVFSFNPTTGSQMVIYSFKGDNDGSAPLAGLTLFGNKLYGTTYVGGDANGGTIFWVDPETGKEQIVHSFVGGSDGSYPSGGLTKVGRTFYGTTSQGGSGDDCYDGVGYGCGTVFAYTP